MFVSTVDRPLNGVSSRSEPPAVSSEIADCEMRIAEWEKLGIADWETSEAQKIVDLRDPDQSGIADCEMRIPKWEKLGIADWRLAKLKKL